MATDRAKKQATIFSKEKRDERDAGCTNTDVLDHCRLPGEHVRGCWVIDLVLGKE
jgi:hypothetical protein